MVEGERESSCCALMFRNDVMEGDVTNFGNCKGRMHGAQKTARPESAKGTGAKQGT